MRLAPPLLLIGLLACTGDADRPAGDTDETDETNETDPPDPCLGEPAVLHLGTGEVAYEALTEGQDLAMVHGPQGGWHFDVSLVLEDVPQRVILEFRVLDATGAPIGIADPLRRSVALPALGGGFEWACDGEWLGERAILDFSKAGAEPGDERPWEAITGEEVVLSAAVRLPGASHAEPGVVLATDQVTIVARPDPCDADPEAEGCAED